VVALRIRIADIGTTNLFDLVGQGRIIENGPSQLSPVSPPTVKDDVIDGRKRQALMVEMSVVHD